MTASLNRATLHSYLFPQTRPVVPIHVTSCPTSLAFKTEVPIPIPALNRRLKGHLDVYHDYPAVTDRNPALPHYRQLR